MGQRTATWPRAFQGQQVIECSTWPLYAEQPRGREGPVSALLLNLLWAQASMCSRRVQLPSQSHPFPRLDWQVLLQCRAFPCSHPPEGSKRAFPSVNQPGADCMEGFLLLVSARGWGVDLASGVVLGLGSFLLHPLPSLGSGQSIWPDLPVSGREEGRNVKNIGNACQ